ncbi:protein YjcZ [Enterobacter asburiae]|uniref:Protein YjcZ n=1 Tax=Enterobacter asburiae TaxID=61645 RepID=A0A376FKT3_ENTAS|nr:protein YjcZ [Enterobacter asburiae]
MLKDNLRSMAANYLAQGINASPTTRHFYHQWLTTPASPGLIDHKDMLGWLGDWCQADQHPVSWSVTQNWQTVALGMPRLCSAKTAGGRDGGRDFWVNPFSLTLSPLGEGMVRCVNDSFLSASVQAGSLAYSRSVSHTAP